MDLALNSLETVGTLFYVVSPNKTSYENVKDVPDYTAKVVPYFLALWILEAIFIRISKKKTVRINDAIASASQSMLYEITRIVTHTWKLAVYIYIYTNWRLVELPWNSLWTWWISVFVVDFLYYWQHRACHEVNFLWAAHQVHHSSEDYNLSTAMRQSTILNFFLSVFALPIALVIPPSAFLVHLELNTLYQFWIHTEAIQSLGPLEYILNTASHHRVHHGRNRYCIDKNFGGVLIIWDRMFETFEAEGKEVVYGLTHPIQSFEPLYIQFSCYVQLWRRFWATEGWKDKLSVIFKGPGWYPGTPWCGSIEDIPEVTAPVQKYDPPLPLWCKVYAFSHVMLMVGFFNEIQVGHTSFPATILYGSVMYVLIFVFTFGLLMEGRSYASWLELLRCILYIGMDYYVLPFTRINSLPQIYQDVFINFLRLAYITSAMFWLQYCMKNISINMYFNSKRWINIFHTKVQQTAFRKYFFVPILILILHNYYYH